MGLTTGTGQGQGGGMGMGGQAGETLSEEERAARQAEREGSREGGASRALLDAVITMLESVSNTE